jgi:hypothetical protein
MSKPKYYWWRDNNYTEKLVTERLSQTTMTFLIFKGSWHVARHCTW